MKKWVPTWRSRRRSVSAPDSSASAIRMRIAKISIDHTNRGRRIQLIPRLRMLWIVTMKLIAPRIDEIEVRWMARIQRSWPWPGEKNFSESGGEVDQAAAPRPVFGEQ